jgi:hypothetical protein
MVQAFAKPTRAAGGVLRSPIVGTGPLSHSASKTTGHGLAPLPLAPRAAEPSAFSVASATGRYPVPRSLASPDSRQHVALPPLVVSIILYHRLSFAALPIVERFNRSDEPLPLVYESRTGSIQYVVSDPITGRSAIIDSVLDFDEKSGATACSGALETHLQLAGLSSRWIAMEPAVQGWRAIPDRRTRCRGDLFARSYTGVDHLSYRRRRMRGPPQGSSTVYLRTPCNAKCGNGLAGKGRSWPMAEARAAARRIRYGAGAGA